MKTSLLIIILVLFCATISDAQIPTDGLIVHYPLRVNAEDASGNGHHLTNLNVTFVPGAVHDPTETHAYFSGNQSCLYYNKSAYHATFNLQTFTISGWARLDDMPNLYGNIFEIGETNFLRFFRPGSGLRRVQSGYRFGLGLDWVTHNLIVAFNSYFSEWHHYVLTSQFENNTNTMTLYIDGQYQISITEEDNPFILYEFSDSLLHVGGRPGANTLNLQGGLLDIFYYNRILNQEEIMQLYDYTLEGPSNTDNPLAAAELKLWPNPNLGILNHNLPDGTLYTLFDPLGRPILIGTSSGSPIDVSSLPTGWYAFQAGHTRQAFYRH